MTTPIIPPGVQHVGLPQTPQPFGLYSVTAPTDLDPPARLLSGIHWTPTNCGPSGIWQHIMCPDPEDPPAQTKTGARPDDDDFPTFVVYAVDECDLYATDTAANQARAAQLLMLHTPLWVEQVFAFELSARAEALPAVTSLTAAVGALEQKLGEGGFSGVLHARRGLSAAAAEHRLTSAQGSTLVTQLGNKVAFGGGYTALGDTIYATGPVTIWRGPVLPRTAIDPATNQRLAIAERSIGFGWECPSTVYSVAVQ
ncbi:hypothetical protein ACPESR_25170 [Nocardia testacea]|uniref:hypothetical protein n=1 Tax=Nocardia testacea TaxID=248551 RepID=UPI003C2C29F3